MRQALADLAKQEQRRAHQHQRIGKIDVEIAVTGREVDLEEHGAGGADRHHPVEQDGIVRCGGGDRGVSGRVLAGTDRQQHGSRADDRDREHADQQREKKRRGARQPDRLQRDDRAHFPQAPAAEAYRQAGGKHDHGSRRGERAIIGVRSEGVAGDHVGGERGELDGERYHGAAQQPQRQRQCHVPQQVRRVMPPGDCRLRRRWPPPPIQARA